MKKINFRIFTYLFFFFIASIISIYSAESISSNLENTFIKQIIYYLIGVIITIFAYKKKDMIINYHYLWYLAFLFLLFILLFLGVSINGSKCWIILGPISFQPSEFMKIFLIITLSKILSKHKKKEFIMLLKCIIITLIPAILTFLEPDTGVVIIYIIITISMVMYHGINKKWYIIFAIILSIIGSGLTSLYFFKNDFLINTISNSIYYRIDRIINWSSGSGYQLENSLIAISSSGLLGFGFNKTPLYFPEANTDFIFTTFASNYGFLGSIFLLYIMLAFDISILKIIKTKTKKSDKYLLVGIFTMLLYQQIQNVCMTIGLLPITGITLPFISYGGSSLLSYMFILGLVLRIINDQYKYMN